MENTKVLQFDAEEFETLIETITDGNVSFDYESSGWFWLVTEEMSEEDGLKLLENELRKKYPSLKIKEVYYDTTNSTILVTYSEENEKIWTVWVTANDMTPYLSGIAKDEETASKMKKYLEENVTNYVSVSKVLVDVNTINVADSFIRF